MTTIKAKDLKVNQVFHHGGDTFQVVRFVRGVCYAKGLVGPLSKMQDSEGNPSTANIPSNYNVKIDS